MKQGLLDIVEVTLPAHCCSCGVLGHPLRHFCLGQISSISEGSTLPVGKFTLTQASLTNPQLRHCADGAPFLSLPKNP